MPNPEFRLERYRPDDEVHLVCKCGHSLIATYSELVRKAGASSTLSEVKRRLRCRVCKARGKVEQVYRFANNKARDR